MKQNNLLKTVLLLCALIVGSASVRATDGLTTLSLSNSAVSFSAPYNGGTAPSSYPSSTTTGNLVCSDDNSYQWSFYYASGSSTKLQIKSKDGILTSPTITSSNGFSVTITYTFSSTSGAIASIKIGDETAVTSTKEGTLTAETESTSTSIVITAPGSRALYITDITITPKAGGSRATTTTTIDASGITNRDLYVSTTAGKLSATVKAGDDIVTGATVTWSSSKPEFATVDASGNVTLVAAGTTVITASYAGDGENYNGSSATYDLTVEDNDPNIMTATFDFSANKYGWDSTSDGNTYYDGSDYNAKEGNITIGFSGKVRLWVSSGNYTMRFYNDATYGRGTMTLTADDGYVITGVSITGSTLSFQNPSSGTIDGGEWTGVAKTLSIEKGTSTSNFTKVEVTYKRAITINAACNDGTSYYGTFYLDQPYIMPEGVEGQTVTVDSEGILSVTTAYAAGATVPANTALLLKAASAGDKVITLTTGGTAPTSNMLKGTLTANDETEGTSCLFYRLTMHNGETIGFYWGAENGAAFKPGANKAYLAVPETLAREGFAFDEATDIKNVNRETITDNRYYTLDGREVKNPTKGIYIVNGKKVVIR